MKIQYKRGWVLDCYVRCSRFVSIENERYFVFQATYRCVESRKVLNLSVKYPSSPACLNAVKKGASFFFDQQNRFVLAFAFKSPKIELILTTFCSVDRDSLFFRVIVEFRCSLVGIKKNNFSIPCEL